ncbi:MAG TPA: hypothetical protein VHV26_17580 [Rhizomicrobium sp.]|nr:hypothetical protein [Rhizomicrobium sp.]
MTLPPRLTHLLKLADQGPTLRAALAEEVADLLAAWPPDYPPEMRSVCETLFARIMDEADTPTRARLHIRRNGASCELDGRALVAAARKGTGLRETLAQLLDVSEAAAEHILRDASGKSLAVAARASNLRRCGFSALALLVHPKTDRAGAHTLLDVYDDLTAAEAARIQRSWRGRPASTE